MKGDEATNLLDLGVEGSSLKGKAILEGVEELLYLCQKGSEDNPKVIKYIKERYK